jgi:hypothetical protein
MNPLVEVYFNTQRTRGYRLEVLKVNFEYIWPFGVIV